MTEKQSEGFRLREGLGIAGFVITLVGAGAVLVFVLGAWKAFVRNTAPTLLDLPGGPWTFGILCGLISVFGVFSGHRLLVADPYGEAWIPRVARSTATAVCWGGALASLSYVLGSLPGRNCPSYRACAYIPGTGSALIAYAGTTAVVGWLVHRVSNARVEKRRALERERVRKMRKKGKGKSRAAARRG
ncbi:hypothetical protein [Streptomyces sp. SID12488]|uniref:hypothetical protein n=1 Tax=Streptomyces sp. SID12488 TaxID=2706040 RepID=UPI0013D93BCB|nr:hypothetical protein [Streptomyces sp. SID12488]NEA67830.1 hypothetical protein [Streptomyces sp. SID12488]